VNHGVSRPEPWGLRLSKAVFGETFEYDDDDGN
jgi:hypothetical protein